MFLRRVVRGQRVYIDLVEGSRDPGTGKVVQRAVAHLGRLEQVERQLPSLIESLSRFTRTPWLDPNQIDVASARDFGGVFGVEHLWRQLGLERILAEETSPEVARICLGVVANRMLAPRSKLATCRWLERVAAPDGREWAIEYRELLEAMDRLHEVQKKVEERVYFQLVDLLRLDLTLVFVDLTSVYVEGEGIDPLMQYGVSKDGKRQNKQFLLALIVTPEGYPLAHFIFPGNKAEKVALLEMLTEMHGRFGIKRCVLVGDRGLISTAVLRALNGAGYEYILALRARQSKTATAALDAETEAWEAIDDNLYVQEVALGREEKVLLVCNEAKIDIDRQWRDALLERAWAAMDKLLARWEAGRITDPQVAITRATHTLTQLDALSFFRVRVTRAGKLEVKENAERIAKEERLDGIFILQSTAKALARTEIVTAYKQLCMVERAFRTLKSFIKLRPVFHFTERRVRTHVFLCVLAYLLETHLDRQLKAAGAELSARAALEALETVRVVDYQLPAAIPTRILKLTKPTPTATTVLEHLGLALPKQLVLPTAT